MARRTYAELVAARVENSYLGVALVDLPETDLVREAIRAILQREYTKDLQANLVSLDDLYYVIRDAARLQLESTPRGIDVRFFAEEVGVLISELAQADHDKVLGQILKLSVFARAGERGRIPVHP